MTFTVKSPFNNEVIGTIVKYGKEDANTVLEKAYLLSKDKSGLLAHSERISILEKLVELVSAQQSEFAALIAKEGGKPLADAKIEVERAIHGIKIAIDEIGHVFSSQSVPMGLTKVSENNMAFSIREPIGVVLAISAFNHPLNLIVHQVVPAIAVGCPVIVKPATSTPLTCEKFVSLVHKAGLNKDMCVYFPCSVDVAETLVVDKRISFFSFIGSSGIGWYLRNKLYPGTRYALEHGGAAPVIIDKDIDDMDSVVKSLVKGAYYHAGQVCISTQRAYIHKDIMIEMSKKITKEVSNLKVGDPSLIETEVGPLISTKEVDRVESWIQEAVAEGAGLLFGGKRISSTLIEPTLLFEPSKTSKVSTQEIFGPVLCLYEYTDINDAIHWANDVNLPFQSAVFSNNINTITKAYTELDSSAVIVNNHTAFRVDWMPFAGRGISGHGIGGIPDTMREMTQHKMIVLKK